VLRNRQVEFGRQLHSGSTDPNSDGIKKSVHHLEIPGNGCGPNGGLEPSGFFKSAPGSTDSVTISLNGGVGEGQ
jgi:hypothetical protein